MPISEATPTHRFALGIVLLVLAVNAAKASDGEADVACNRALQLGDARQFWDDLRIREAARQADLMRQMQAEMGQFSAEEAADRLVATYSRETGVESGCPVGWFAVDDLVAKATAGVLVTAPLPLLSTPDLQGEQLEVLTVVAATSYLPVLEMHTGSVGLQFWGDHRPSNGGEWAHVLTRDGTSGWVHLESGRASSVAIAPPPPPPAPPEARSHSALLAIALILLAGVAILALVKIVGAVAAAARPKTRPTVHPRQASAGSSDNAFDNGPQSEQAGNWFSEVFGSRTASDPKQGFFESDEDFRRRVREEGLERVAEDLRGEAPRQGFFEGNGAYKQRVREEINAEIIERATGQAPRQGLFESDESYRGRVSEEVRDAIIEAATGSPPHQGFFESDEAYGSRLSEEADASIIESATGSSPKQGFFESDDSFRERVREEMEAIRASKRD